jgi:hypothetical protein
VRTGVTLLYISGYVDSIAMDSIARHCPEAVLLKPFDKGALVARVRQLLSPSHPETPFDNCSKSTPGPATES